MESSVGQFFSDYIVRFLSDNRAGCLMNDLLAQCGVGLMPLVDHCTMRTHDVDKGQKRSSHSVIARMRILVFWNLTAGGPRFTGSRDTRHFLSIRRLKESGAGKV